MTKSFVIYLIRAMARTYELLPTSHAARRIHPNPIHLISTRLDSVPIQSRVYIYSKYTHNQHYIYIRDSTRRNTPPSGVRSLPNQPINSTRTKSHKKLNPSKNATTNNHLPGDTSPPKENNPFNNPPLKTPPALPNPLHRPKTNHQSRCHRPDPRYRALESPLTQTHHHHQH